MTVTPQRKFKTLAIAMTLAGCLFVTRCASKTETPRLSDASIKQNEIAFDAQFNRLQGQMSFDQVKGLLGPPELRELKGKTETWHYTKKYFNDAANNGNISRKVVFEDGKVTEFGADQQQQPVVQVMAAPTPGVNLEIGQACKLDKECKLHNCHFHACAGPNNCTVTLGQVCAVDTDCCSNFCDFGFCKTR